MGMTSQTGRVTIAGARSNSIVGWASRVCQLILQLPVPESY